MSHALLIGDINVDTLLTVDHYPRRGDDAQVHRTWLRPGGTVANTGVVLAKLGVSTRLVGCVGMDVWADLALDGLAQAGVDVRAVRRTEQAGTGLITIPITPDGERTMFSYRGANVYLPPEAITGDLLDQAAVLHISGYNLLTAPQRDATERALAWAWERGLPVSLDVGLEPARRIGAEIRALAPRLAILSLGMDEACRLWQVETWQEVTTQARRCGAALVGLKRGAQGCVLIRGAEWVDLSAISVTPVDTTGAGDAFAAGLIAGWLWALSLPATGLLATILGGLATTVWGGGPDLPGRAEVLAYLAAAQDVLPAETAGELRARLTSDPTAGPGSPS